MKEAPAERTVSTYSGAKNEAELRNMLSSPQQQCKYKKQAFSKKRKPA